MQPAAGQGEPAVQLALDHLSRWQSESTLVVDPPPGSEALFSFATIFSVDARAKTPHQGPWYAGHGHTSALVFLPKGRQRRDMWLAMTASALETGSPIAIVGHRKAGIKPAKRALQQVSTQPVTTEVGRHCQLHRGAAAYTAASLDDFVTEWAHEGLRMVAFPGVFASGRVDEAAALLAQHATVHGRVLDLACGPGVVSMLLMQKHEATFVLSDVDHLSVEAARRSIKLNPSLASAAAASVVAGDCFDSIEGRFDHIVINPPFHSGVQTDYTIAERMLSNAKHHIAPEGRLWVVANRFLPYDEILERHFASVTVPHQTSRFRIWKAVV